ncbi:MAG: right-handed parallel beta-helix repeat-containing protein, partial [Chloroflexi bacterium]|nr:right-handed parallel beta-helix repeat-containing protein [Chloroflexota bacterium]
FVIGPGTPGSRGFYVNRADDVTIQGITVRNFDTGIYLRGTGPSPGPQVYNATIVYNTLESNRSHAIWGSYVYTSTICSNDIILGNNGIYLENSHGNTVCYNTISQNLGFGVKLNTGSENSIDNNEINNNQNVGIELVGQTERNGIYGNHLHDLWWDGIIVSGTLASDVHVAANTIANTNQAWLNAAGNPPDGYHNRGGIVLMGITGGSEVRDNRITGASNGLGNRADAAGIYLLNNTAPITIESNLIQNGIGHGIYITACTGLPVIHGNSIYGNSLFGLNNQLATRVHAEGNWWGRNAPTFGPSTPADIRTAASAYYSPPISLTLTAAPASIPANGVATSTITATASGGGYNILDGTWITFTSDLNTSVLPAFAAFGGGRANTVLTAGTLAGVATITGMAEPGLEGQIVTVTLTAGAPHTMALDVMTRTIPNSCDTSQGWTVVTATVRDRYGNPVPGVPVTFTSNALGSVFPNTGTTLAGTGSASTTFTSSVLTGTAVITAIAGATLTTVTNITVTAGPPSTMNIVADPSTLLANGVATSTVTVTLRDCLGYAVPDGTMVAFTTTLGSILNQEFAEAESAAVLTSTGWTPIADGSASGGTYIRTTTPGATAYWLFRGEAISLIYRRFSGGGVMRVRVDGGAPVDIDTNGSAAWVERVIATNLNPAISHQIEVTCQSGQIRLDAFRSGSLSNGGVVRAILRAPVLVILGPQVYTSTVYATSRLGHPVLPNMVVTTVVTFTQADVVWVNDDWAGLPNGSEVTLPPEHGSGKAYIGSNAFDTIPKGVAAVKEGGTVQVLTGTYASQVVITKTLNLLGDGSANTFIVGSGTGNGIQVERFADGVTIEGFTIRNFGYGVHLDGRSANRIEGITFANNVITGCATGAITATYLNNGYFAGNVLSNDGGFGLDLYVGDPNRIVNNHIYNIPGFGLRIRNALGTEISYNQIHDVDWNGIVVGDSCTNTLVLHNIVRTTNRVNSPSGFNEGGIVLYNTTNTTVEYNDVSDVRDAGGSTDTAGIWVGGTDTNAAIRYNRILYNTNDGVLLWGFNAASPPVINCNHIYGNLRFGVRNTQVTTVNAEGNWWGRNTPTTGTSAPRDIYRPPVNVDYTPWITVALTPSQPAVDAGSSAIVITAIGYGGGCSILNGTPITFTSSLGLLGDPPRSMVTDTIQGGQVTVLFTPGTIAGTANITGTVPNGGIVTTSVTILPLGPASIDVTAYPSRIAVDGTAAVTAIVRDTYGNPVLPGTLIYFDTSLGSVSPASSGTDASGVANSTLYAGTVPGVATVRAYRGSVSGFDQVEITAGPPFTITSLIANPSAIPANGLATSLLTAIVKDRYDNLVPDGTMVGFTTTAGSLLYEYVEA